MCDKIEAKQYLVCAEVIMCLNKQVLRAWVNLLFIK